MRKLFDLQHPFFRPLWIRVTTTAAIFAWGTLEIYWGNGFWATMFWSLGIYCAWEFYFGPPPREPEDRKEDPE